MGELNMILDSNKVRINNVKTEDFEELKKIYPFRHDKFGGAEWIEVDLITFFKE